MLYAVVAEAQRTVDIELIEANFENIWPTLSDVNFLFLDGPKTTTNFDPFADNFIYLLHDTHLRLRDSDLIYYTEHLCRSDDEAILMDSEFQKLREDLKKPFYINKASTVHKGSGNLPAIVLKTNTGCVCLRP